MPGVFVSNKIELSIARDYPYYSYVEGSNNVDGFYVYRKVLDKFQDDKLFRESNKLFVFTDGVCLNLQELLEKYEEEDYFSLIESLYFKEPIFPNVLRGSFSGAIYSKEERKWTFYTNHTGTKPLFYYQNGDMWIVSSSICYIADNLKKNGIPYTLDTNSAYCLMSYGFMIGDDTLIKEVKRLKPGSIIAIDSNNKLVIKQYYRLDNTPNYNLSPEAIMDSMDDLFTKAVKRGFLKDDEYGYEHICQLSGGLDSRYNLWVAHEKLKFKNITAYCFSQSNTLDQKISQKIAAEVGVEYIFKNLDDALFIKDLEESIFINYGLCCSSGQLHWMRCERDFNLKIFGLRHDGILGDVIAGSYCKDDSGYNTPSTPMGNNSRYLIDKTKVDFDKWDNIELFLLYNRGLNGITCSEFVRDTTSPFLDVDFINFCLSIPITIRKEGDGIYHRLLMKKYPAFCKYRWESTNSYLGASKLSIAIAKLKQFGIKYAVLKIINKVFKLHIKNDRGKNWMNPYEYWYESIEELRTFMDSYFENNIKLISEPELKKDMADMYQHVSAREKIQVLTTIMAIKYYFS